MQDNSTTNDTCPNCSASEFEQGWCHAYGSGAKLFYCRADEGPGLFGGRGTMVTIRRCLSCGHLDLFAVTDRK
jgi:hypothetical protein